MDRAEMGAWSKTIAEKGLNGFVLGQLIFARLHAIPLPAEFGLSTDINERVTPGEIIDAIETVEQARQALTVLANALAK